MKLINHLFSSDTCNNETDGATQKDSAELVNNNVKKEGRIRPQIFTATSAIPTPLCGYKPFRHQVGGHLMVQDSPCKYFKFLKLSNNSIPNSCR